ncbi:unnamed protein product [Oreochromis niloticus]|nr:unnamed protein product [Mustela putorius furo]
MECKLHNMKKQNEVLQVEINEVLQRNAQVVHEKKQLETEYRELEGRNKDMEERHKEMLVNQQKQPNVDIINEGWGVMFNQAKQRIVSLMTEKKQNIRELRTMSCQLQQVQAVSLETYENLEHAVNLNQQLQVQLDEALEKNEKFLQEKKQQDIKEKEMECKLHNMKKQNEVLQVEINEVLQRNAQVVHEKKQLETEYRELEGRNKDMEERHKEMLVNQQKQPNVDIINEGWGVMFNQAKQRIVSLMTEKKQNIRELRTMSCQLQQVQAVSLETYENLEHAVNLNQQLQVQLDEALEKNEKFLQEKKQQDIKEKEMECKLHNMKKQNEVLQVEINEVLQRNAQVVHEKKQLETEYRELEGRNKDMEERHKEMLVNQQKQPNVDIINEGWGVMFNEAKQRFGSLMTEKKQNIRELRTMSCQLQQAQAVSLETYENLEHAVNLNQQLQVQLDEALDKNEKFLQEKKQQDIKEKEMECKLHNMKKQNEVLQVEINEVLQRNAQVVHEKEQLETEYRELEGRNKDMEERHKEMLVNQQKQPNVDIINEGWGVMFNQAKQRIVSLMTEKKQNIRELRTMSCQLQQAQAVSLETHENLEHAVNLNQQLQVQLDEALEKNEKFLQEKKQQDIKEKEMECKLHNMKKQNEVLQVEINEVLQRNAQVVHEKKQLETEYRELEGRNKDMEERHKEMLVNQQKQPNVDIINEGWGVMFNEAKQRFGSLMTEKKQNIRELRTMSCQLQQAQAVSLETYENLEHAVNLNQQLQV